MVLQSYTTFSARNSSTTLFLHHWWSIGNNTQYQWGFAAVMGCPSSVGDEHSQRAWESQVWQSNRALHNGHPFLLSAFPTEDPRLPGNPYLRQLQAGQHHPAECAQVNADPKAYIHKHNYSVLDSAWLMWSAVCEYQAQRQRKPSQAYPLSRIST